MTISQFIWLCSFGTLFSLPTHAQELVSVAWRTKPPYQYLENGEEKGFLLDRAKQIFMQAQIPTKFINEPGNRIWSNFSSGKKSYCSFDWFRIPQREPLVQFSQPFNHSPPYAVLASPMAFSHVSAHKSITSLLSDTNLTLGLVDAASYGTELDAMIRNGKNKLERNMVLPMILARMVSANRVSYMFIDRVDWAYLKDTGSQLYSGRLVDIGGMPAGLDSYIVCSKDISPAQMANINASIAKITHLHSGKR